MFTKCVGDYFSLWSVMERRASRSRQNICEMREKSNCGGGASTAAVHCATNLAHSKLVRVTAAIEVTVNTSASTTVNMDSLFHRRRRRNETWAISMALKTCGDWTCSQNVTRRMIDACTCLSPLTPSLQKCTKEKKMWANPTTPTDILSSLDPRAWPLYKTGKFEKE